MVSINCGWEERDRLQEEWHGAVFMKDESEAHLKLEAPSVETGQQGVCEKCS